MSRSLMRNGQGSSTTNLSEPSGCVCLGDGVRARRDRMGRGVSEEIPLPARGNPLFPPMIATARRWAHCQRVARGGGPDPRSLRATGLPRRLATCTPVQDDQREQDPSGRDLTLSCPGGRARRGSHCGHMSAPLSAHANCRMSTRRRQRLRPPPTSTDCSPHALVAGLLGRPDCSSSQDGSAETNVEKVVAMLQVIFAVDPTDTFWEKVAIIGGGAFS